MRLAGTGPSILQPLIENVGWTKVWRACESALGIPPELVMEISEVRKIVSELEGGAS